MGISLAAWKAVCGDREDLIDLHPAVAARSLLSDPEKPHKYHAQATEYNGRKYPSKSQAARAYDLDMLTRSKAIHGYVEEVTFRLGPDFRYRADFVVADASRMWAEDVKGFATPRFKQAVKLWRKYGPFPLHVIGNKSTEVIGGGG